MWKWVSIVLLLVLLLTNGFWLYLALDWGSGEKYRQQTAYERENQVEALKSLAEHFISGSSKVDLADTLAEVFPDEDPFEKEGAANCLWLSFPISPEGLVEGIEVSP